YRAQLRGWRFIYLTDVVVPAELPPDMDGFKSQQHRWTKGSIQVCKKIIADVLVQARVQKGVPKKPANHTERKMLGRYFQIMQIIITTNPVTP
ncbi:MAG: glycosyl transferase family 2, partial [bacterium]